MVAHQRSLFATGDPAIDTDVTVERIALDERSWVDVARNWFRGADAVLDVLVDTVEWHQGRRRMWDRMVDDPRLSHWCRDGDPLPHPCVRRDPQRTRGALLAYRSARSASTTTATATTASRRTPTASYASSTTRSSRSSRSEPGVRSSSARNSVKRTVGGRRSTLRLRPVTCS